MTIIHLPEPEPPDANEGIYLGDSAYVLPESEHNCIDWTIHTQRENGVHHVTLGRSEMEILIRVYNETRKP